MATARGGWTDQQVTPQTSTIYYEKVVKTVGRDAAEQGETQDGRVVEPPERRHDRGDGVALRQL